MKRLFHQLTKLMHVVNSLDETTFNVNLVFCLFQLKFMSINPFLYNHGFSRVYLIRTITAFNVSTLSVQSRLFTYLPYSNNHGFSRVPFSTLKNRLFRRCLKSMIYEIIRVKCYLYFGVSKPICLFFGKGSYFKLKKVGVWKYTCVSAEIKL